MEEPVTKPIGDQNKSKPNVYSGMQTFPHLNISQLSPSRGWVRLAPLCGYLCAVGNTDSQVLFFQLLIPCNLFRSPGSLGSAAVSRYWRSAITEWTTVHLRIYSLGVWKALQWNSVTWWIFPSYFACLRSPKWYTYLKVMEYLRMECKHDCMWSSSLFLSRVGRPKLWVLPYILL